ncbi:hypothetical protein LCGC14_2108090 [marine sediment metagenome]|uniref:Uncharacterized protein n=1 Tax=marine sediment metagenome TaxID=412755 RepID=A0A0F9E835_9ZZZZ
MGRTLSTEQQRFKSDVTAAFYVEKGHTFKGSLLEYREANHVFPLKMMIKACGSEVIYKSMDEIPEGSVPCICGDPTHWFIFIENKR